MGDIEGGLEAYGVAENPGGDCQGVGGGVESPRGTNTPRVEELPWGDENSGVTLEVDGVQGAEGQGRGWDGNPPATRDTKGSGDTSRGEEMASGQEPTAPQIPHRGKAEGEIGDVSTQRHPEGTYGARPEHGKLARREYILLDPEDLTGNPAAAEPQGRREKPKDTTRTGDTDGRETGTGERNGQRALLVRGHPEGGEEE